jgi:hypothetical protein
MGERLWRALVEVERHYGAYALRESQEAVD